jgi:phytoene desaturase
LFFDVDFDQHAADIYKHPRWPDDPAMYVSCSSKTDMDIAPAGHENIIVLIPVAPGLPDNPDLRDKYYKMVIKKLQQVTGQSIEEHVVYSRSYAYEDFVNDYHAFKGNAYGLANTLFQTAFLKPGMVNKKIKNLIYTGQLTVPGPGVPPSIISGKLAADLIDEHFNN